MPLTGGPADKLGNRYELAWTVSQLIRLVHDFATSIRIEDPGITKAEFTYTGNHRELHQAKRSNPYGKWSLSSLGAADIELLQTIYLQLLGNTDSFVFVSSSDARELSELAERAQHAESFPEFDGTFLQAKSQRESFKKLIDEYWHCESETAFDILRRIEVRTIDERSLEDEIKWRSQVLYFAKPVDIIQSLRSLAIDSVHKTITRDDVVGYLADRGFALRRLQKSANAPALIREVTDQYLKSVERRLLRHELLPRSPTQEFLKAIDSEIQNIVMLGKAGVGKSVCISECICKLRDRDIPVLAFRLDRLPMVKNTPDLGRELGLEESPALVLQAATTSQGVLIIDQLDSVGTTSGRATEFFDAIEDLCAEASGLKSQVKIHLLIVCRKFDWENDRRLRRLLFRQHDVIEIPEFTVDEVKEILRKEGFEPNFFHPRQLNLLRLPQNLSLFLESRFPLTQTPAFQSAKDIFDKYWDEKRQAVGKRAAPTDQWFDVINTLCDQMTDQQQLWARRETLDKYSPVYVGQMTSEGVLNFDGERFSFGHESFFDYCFARTFIEHSETLAAFLHKSEQHLFRRAQVRQVLSYLRDGNRQRYIQEVTNILSDGGIRTHLKDLTFALLANAPDPSEQEWEIWRGWLQPMLRDFAENQPLTKESQMAWQHFYRSPAWFDFADDRGLISEWLASPVDNIVNFAINYLRAHQRERPDPVARLLSPYVNKGADWALRLRHLVQWSDPSASRQFFELFLTLIDNGTLDEARGPIAVNSSFWSIVYSLEKKPHWLIEAITHRIKRRLAIAQAIGAELTEESVFGRDVSAVKLIHDAATGAPADFVRAILPIIVEISALAARPGDHPPHRDTVWFILGSHLSPAGACLEALISAMRSIIPQDREYGPHIIPELRQHETQIANFILINLLTVAGPTFAGEAVDLLIDNDWRFRCGYPDSAFWCTRQLIAAIADHCNVARLSRLEESILRYRTPAERSKKYAKHAGFASYCLLDAIPERLRSPAGQRRYGEYQRKFGEPEGPPQGIHGGVVHSPIPDDAAQKMSDEQWLKAIRKHDTDRTETFDEDFLKGGSGELALQMANIARTQPERFARLSLSFPSDANPAYLQHLLMLLTKTEMSADLKLDVCRKAFRDCVEKCGSFIADVLGSIKDSIPADAVDMLRFLATEHANPLEEHWQEDAGGFGQNEGHIEVSGINTTRGRACEAIGTLIQRNASNIKTFENTLHEIVNDPSPAVRSCVGFVLRVVAFHNKELGFTLFSEMDLSSQDLLASNHIWHFIAAGLPDHFAELRPHVERLLRSTHKGCEGAMLASLAALDNDSAADLADEALGGSALQRKGVARIAAANVDSPLYRSWCEQGLFPLFNDESAEVRREASSCFRHISPQSLGQFQDLITAFCGSKAFEDDSFSILHSLENAVSTPGITCFVCEQFIERFADEARDIRTSRAANVGSVTKLVFRTYQQHQNDEWTARTLTLIDRMCLECISEVMRGFEDFER